MKNILFVNTGVVWGGVENWHYNSAVGLKKRGYNVYCMAFEGSPFYNKCIDAGLDVISIKRIREFTWLNPFRIHALTSFLKKNNINVVFFCQAPHFKFVSIAAKCAGVERIVYRRALAKPIKKKFYNIFLIKHCVTDILGISEITLKETLKYLPDDISIQKNIIYNGVNIDKFIDMAEESNLRKEFNIKDAELFIVNVGRLCPQKAQDRFIHAISELVKKGFENFKAVIVGRGEDEEELKNLCRELQLEDKVVFAGFREDVGCFLKQADFMVHTAVYEGCPWVIIEAMLSSLPVVALNISTLPEFVVDGKTGYLASPEDNVDIADKIIKIMDSSLRGKMGKHAFSIAEKKYTSQTMLDGIEKTFLL